MTSRAINRLWAMAVFALAMYLSACSDSGKSSTNAPPPAPPPTEVDVITIVSRTATITQDLPGRLTAFRTAQVRARVEGIIERRLFTEGSDVAAGAPLFQIDGRSYRATTTAAEADLAMAQAVLDRYRPLMEIKAVSQQEFDQANAKVKQAEAALVKAKLDLENTVSPAPTSGRIGRALVTEGALVGRGEATHLATIEQINPIRAEFTQSYADLLRLQNALKSGKQKRADSAKVELILEDGSTYAEPGQMQFTDLAVDSATGSIALRAEFPNPRKELLPGTFVRIRFPQAKIEKAIRVPQRAVQTAAQGQSVMVVDSEAKVSPRPIKTSGMAGTDFIVTEGLAPGDQVIVNGLQKIRPGAVVKPVPWNPQVEHLPTPPSTK